MSEALGVLRDLFFELDPRDVVRLKDVLVQAKSAHRGAIVRNGLSLALSHAARGLNPESYFYSYDYRQRTTVTGLPIIPSLGIKGEF